MNYLFTMIYMILEIPPLVVADVLKMLKGRILYGRDFYLVNSVSDSVVNFSPVPDNPTWRLDDSSMQLVLGVSEDLAKQFAEMLMQEVGVYSFPSLPHFTVRVVDLATWNIAPLNP